MTTLLELDLDRNEISQITNTEDLIELKKLSINFNRIQEIRGLDNLKLEQLHISKLNAIQTTTKLR